MTRRATLFGATMIGGLLAAGVAFAADEGGAKVSEVVVTAQKRSQSIESVGMAITAQTGDELKLKQVNDIDGLAKIEPTFTVTRNLWGGPIYQIRGVGFIDFSLSATPTVSAYSDEVPYVSPNTSKGATMDLERVEVLKGPQGTLFGENATGGAVNYIAHKPTASFAAGADATYALYNAFNASGYVSGPITDTLNARFAAKLEQGGAYQKSISRDDTNGAADRKFGRLLFDWRPSDRLKVSLNLNGWTDHSQLIAGSNVKVVISRPQNAASVPKLVNAPTAPENDRGTDWIAGTHPKADEKFYQGAVRADYDLRDDVQLTYVGSYQNYRQDDLLEPAGMDVVFYLRQRGEVSSNFHELRLSGEARDKTVIWLAGVNFKKARTDENDIQNVSGISSAFSLAAFDPLHRPRVSYQNISTDDSQTKAVFGNVEVHPTSTFDVHAGLRYTEADTKHGGCTADSGDGITAASFNGNAANLLAQGKVTGPLVPAVAGGCVTLDSRGDPTFFKQTLDENNVSWRVGADWTPRPGALFYASVAKGFKAGSFPTLTASATAQLVPVVQESVLAYEIGTKARLLGDRLRIDADAFWYDYRDKQFQSKRPDPSFGTLNVLVNIPKSEEKGVEVTLTANPVDPLTVTLNGTYVQTRVTSHFLGYNVFSTIPVDLFGESFPATPKWAFRADAEYTWRVKDGYTGFAGFNARYQTGAQGTFGSASLTQQGFPTTYVKAFGVLDLRAGVRSDDGHWRFIGFVNNATDKYYWLEETRTSESVTRFTGMPRTYGLTVEYKY